MQEKTWILRHRILEDSLVVAEQQSESGSHWCFSSLPRNGNHVGMKDISSPEPWSNLTCHSFHSAMMSCNKSQDLL
jgi:regulator-associated protein of mTOR